MGNAFTTLCKGDANFIRAVGIPIAASVEQALADSAFECDDSFMDRDELLHLDREPRADLSVIVAGVVGVLCYLGTWAVSKFLDEVYSLKLQPALQKCLKSLGAKSATSEGTGCKHFLFGIWLEDQRLLVLARLEAEDYATLAGLTGEVPGCLSRGATAMLGTKAFGQIHLYRITEDSVGRSPQVVKNIEEAIYGHARSTSHDQNEVSRRALGREGQEWRWESGQGFSVQIGYVNGRGQRCCGHRGVHGSDYNQFAYKVECTHCGFVYGANGSDLHERRCPKCQGGANGIRFWAVQNHQDS